MFKVQSPVKTGLKRASGIKKSLSETGQAFAKNRCEYLFKRLYRHILQYTFP